MLTLDSLLILIAEWSEGAEGGREGERERSVDVRRGRRKEAGLFLVFLIFILARFPLLWIGKTKHFHSTRL